MKIRLNMLTDDMTCLYQEIEQSNENHKQVIELLTQRLRGLEQLVDQLMLIEEARR